MTDEPEGRPCDLGSFRASAGFIADGAAEAPAFQDYQAVALHRFGAAGNRWRHLEEKPNLTLR